MKKISLLAVLLFSQCIVFAENLNNKFKEGDIIFQTSKSQQSKFIAYATHSLDTHCGIIINKNNELYVLEASNIIKISKLQKFIDKGLFKKYSVYRYSNNQIKISYKKYLGIPYDSQFKWSDEKYYCSELVWKIFKYQLNVELCNPRKLSSYTTFGLDRILKKRGINKESVFVAPVDISTSKKLYQIR